MYGKMNLTMRCREMGDSGHDSGGFYGSTGNCIS